MICEVIPEKRTSPDKDTFTYKVPANLENQIKIGSIVNISFGKKSILGVVASLDCHPERPKGAEGSINMIDSSLNAQNDYLGYEQIGRAHV